MNGHKGTTETDDLTDWMQAAAEVEQVRGGQLAVLAVLAIVVVVAGYLV